LGVQERGLTTLLRSSVQNIKPALGTQKVSEQSIILPYIQRRQRSYVNSNYFNIEDGSGQSLNVGDINELGAWGGLAATGHGTDTAGVADDRMLNLRIASTDWGEDVGSVKNTFRGGPTSPARFFLPGSTLIVYTLDTGNTNGTYVLEVVESYDHDSDPTKCYVKCKAAYSATGKGAAADPAIEIGSGLAQIGANNISDWEDWCNNQPSDFNQRIIVNWLQTSRESRSVDQVYKDTLARVLGGEVNEYAAKFKYLPLAEQNRQAAAHSDNAWLRSTFYGQSINENQTVEGYTNLPEVYDPESGTSFGNYPGGQPTAGESCVMEYKANAIGIYTQLKEASRIADFAGGQLNLDTLMQHIYYLKRYRESDGDNIDVIDIMTDRYTADNLMVAFSRYYQAKYGAQVNRFVDQGKKLEFNNQVLFNYNVYDLPEIGVQIAVFHDPFFDDIISAAGQVSGVDTAGGAVTAADYKSSRRCLYMLDWSDINIGIAGTNSVTRKHPNVEAQEMYKCRMEANVREYQLKSTKWTTMLDRPQRHLIVENFSDDLPAISTPFGALISDGTGTGTGNAGNAGDMDQAGIFTNIP